MGTCLQLALECAEQNPAEGWRGMRSSGERGPLRSSRPCATCLRLFMINWQGRGCIFKRRLESNVPKLK